MLRKIGLRVRCGSALVAVLAAATAPSAGQTGSFSRIPLPTGFDFIEVRSISGDGSTVVGEAIDNPEFPPSGPPMRHAFRWTAAGGLEIPEW